MSEIHNPNAPADCKTVCASVADSGDVELKLVDDCNAGYAGIVIERAGTRLRKITINGVVILDETT